MAKGDKNENDFDAENYTKRVEGLEAFKAEFEGKEFDKKVASSIEDSRLVEEKIKKIVWDTIKSKITWIIWGGVGIVLTDLLIRAIPSILKSLGGN